MTSQHLLDRGGLGGVTMMDRSPKYTTPVMSVNPIPPASTHVAAGNEVHDEAAARTVFWIFLSVLIALCGAAMYLLWCKLTGSM